MENKIVKMQELVNKLNYWTKLYDEGNPEVTDKEWDDKYFQLVALENETKIYLNDSPTQKISYSIVNELKKVNHNHPMLSLAKTKDLNEVDTFIGERDYIAMCKMDGLTCSLRYIDGKLISAETRGNGSIGEDILHNALVIPSIPKKIRYTEELIVDGEIICTDKDFISFSKKYKNPRNFAAGSIRLLDSKECQKRKLTFVAWDVIKGFEEKKTGNYLHNCFDFLYLLGFTVVPYTAFLNSWQEEVDFLKDESIKYGYPIDGIVFKYDDREYSKKLGRTDHHFKNAIAYKFYDETYCTTVKRVEWTMGRTGTLTPVVIFEPVDIDGAIVERASTHNLARFKDLNLHYQGQKIEVYKANLIIPQISKVYEYDGKYEFSSEIKIPEVCPICGEPLKQITLNYTENLICSNPNCEGKLVNKLDHFCGKKGLDIKGLSKATLNKLINLNWLNNCEDIFSLSKHSKEWMTLPGFGEKSVNKIISAIETSKKCSLNNFIAAIGIPLIGSTAAKELVKYFPTWNDFIFAVDNKYEFSFLPNFGYEMEKSLNNFDYTEAKRIYQFLDIKKEESEKKKTSISLEGLTFVITGKLINYKNRDMLKADIEANGGRVSNSISKKTDYLINNDKESTSTKNKAAIANKIPILTEKDFIEKFLTF